MTAIASTISRRVHALRKERQISLQTLADRAGLSKSHIWDIEKGNSSNPTIETAVAIASALGVSLDYLCGLSTTQPALHPEALRIACEIDALIKARPLHSPLG